jgi:hypothetical protein
LSGLVFAGAFLAGVHLLSQWKLARLDQWPGIHGPSFHLVPGEAGVWYPAWPLPLDDGVSWSALSLETESAIERPETLEVLVGIDPLVLTGHAREWLGAPTDWMHRGIDVLPVRDPSHPLMLEGTAVTRISWRVERVEGPLAGSTARIVLGAPPVTVEYVNSVKSDLRSLLLPVLGVVGFLILGMGWMIHVRSVARTRASDGKPWHDRAPLTGGSSAWIE